MTDLRQAAQMAVDALELSAVTVDSFGVRAATQAAITALRTALAREHAMHELARLGQEIEQEPLCRNCIGSGWEPTMYDGRRPCGFCQSAPSQPQQQAEPPPQRQWQGLTGQEKDMIAGVSIDVFEAMYRVEAKLKERNT